MVSSSSSHEVATSQLCSSSHSGTFAGGCPATRGKRGGGVSSLSYIDTSLLLAALSSAGSGPDPCNLLDSSLSLSTFNSLVSTDGSTFKYIQKLTTFHMPPLSYWLISHSSLLIRLLPPLLASTVQSQPRSQKDPLKIEVIYDGTLHH